MSFRGKGAAVTASVLVIAGGLEAYNVYNNNKCVIDAMASDSKVKGLLGCIGIEGGTKADVAISPMLKQTEDAPSTVQVHTLGEVVMTLDGEAKADLRNTGWNLLKYGNLFGTTDNTWYWNKDNKNRHTVVYNPCFGTGNDLADAKVPSGYNDSPVSNVNITVQMDSGGNAHVTADLGAMEACYMRVTNSVDQPGGATNEQMWTNKNGNGFRITNGNTDAMNLIKNDMAARINALLIDSALWQACPEEALSKSGLPMPKIRSVMASAVLGPTLDLFPGKAYKAKRQAINDAYDTAVNYAKTHPDEAFSTGSFVIKIANSSERVDRYAKVFSDRRAELLGKKVTLTDGIEVTYKTIGVSKIEGCGTGSLKAGN